MFGTDAVRDAIHGASGQHATRMEADHWFDASIFPTTAVGTNCTCVIVKPHIVAAGLAG